MALDELLARLDRPTLFGARWRYRRGDYTAAAAELDALAARLRAEGTIEARAVGGFFRCRRAGPATVAIRDPAGKSELRFDFPAERTRARRSLAAYFAESGDAIALLAATIGKGLPAASVALRNKGELEGYWRLHGLGAALAETAIALAHERLAAQMIAAGAACEGKRYSFGFPACPGIERQGDLLGLLGADRIGLSLTSGFQLVPEHSVTAFVIARTDAEYFTA